jgi:hypothetical protein
VEYECGIVNSHCNTLSGCTRAGGAVPLSTDTLLVPEYFCFNPEQRCPYLGTSRVSLQEAVFQNEGLISDNIFVYNIFKRPLNLASGSIGHKLVGHFKS